MSVPIFCWISCGFRRFVQPNWEKQIGQSPFSTGLGFLWGGIGRTAGGYEAHRTCCFIVTGQRFHNETACAACELHRVFVLNVATWRRSTQRPNNQNLNFKTPNTKISTEHWSLKPEHTLNLKTMPLDQLWRFRVFMVLRVYAPVRKFTLTCFLGCVMRCCETLMTVKSSVCGVRWCLYVVHALCCAALWRLGAIIFVWTSSASSWETDPFWHLLLSSLMTSLLPSTRLKTLKVQLDVGRQTLETVTLWVASLTPPWGFPQSSCWTSPGRSSPANTQREDLVFVRKGGFGFWCLCEVRGCSGAKLFQVVQVCREVWEGVAGWV